MYDEHDWYCEECQQKCEIIEESFDYAGTHCTYGKSGTHYTGHFVSKCCNAPLVDFEDLGYAEE